MSQNIEGIFKNKNHFIMEMTLPPSRETTKMMLNQHNLNVLTASVLQKKYQQFIIKKLMSKSEFQ